VWGFLFFFFFFFFFFGLLFTARGVGGIARHGIVYDKLYAFIFCLLIFYSLLFLSLSLSLILFVDWFSGVQKNG